MPNRITANNNKEAVFIEKEIWINLTKSLILYINKN